MAAVIRVLSALLVSLASVSPVLANDAVPTGSPRLWESFVASVRAADSGASTDHADVQAFYERRGWQPAWVVDGQITRQGRRVIEVLRRASDHGLPLEPFDTTRRVGVVDGALGSLDAVELTITTRLLAYARQVADGRSDPRGVSTMWSFQPRRTDVAALLADAVQGGRADAAIESLAPTHRQYRALQEALAHYRRMEAKGAWEPLPPPARVPGVPRGAGGVALLARRLTIEGDHPHGAWTAASVKHALDAFQRRHGLPGGGKMDAATLAALDVPVAERITQIELALERWRWLPRDLGQKHVLVNIAGFHLWAVEDGREALSMRVVTGRPDTPTPVFSLDMTGLALSPWWNVPQSIVENEILPKLRSSPGYLRKANLVRDGASFRQPPGPRNALGLVKFVLPGSSSIYLHDTPAKALFARTGRAFSHGCVRLEKPTELAQWLLADREEWTEAKLRSAMSSGREQPVALDEPVPVHIIYMTTWVGGDGTVSFHPDVYGHDAVQRPLLTRPATAGERVASAALSPGR